MSHKVKIIIVLTILVLCISIWCFFFSTKKAHDTSTSGILFGNQVWSGDIYITGDVKVLGNLTILPGTTVKFHVGDDQKDGEEVPPDGFNDSDPTRLKSYTTTHSSLFVLRKFIARGEPSKPIFFTSAAAKPDLADWEAIIFMGNGSVVDNVIVEYSRNGLNPSGNQPNSVIQNSISRHVLWGAISSANSNIKIIHNHLYDAGHEGIDLKFDGDQEVSGNIIDDCHAGIVSVAGSQTIKDNIITNCGAGVSISPESRAVSISNTFLPAPEDSKRVWRYGNYEIPVFGNP